MLGSDSDVDSRRQVFYGDRRQTIVEVPGSELARSSVPPAQGCAVRSHRTSGPSSGRDHDRVIQVGGGAIMVALGLLLFFERFDVLRVDLNRFLVWLGLEPAF